MSLLDLGHPVIPDIPGREHIITSDDAFFLEKLPKKVVIVGMNLNEIVQMLYEGDIFDV